MTHRSMPTPAPSSPVADSPRLVLASASPRRAQLLARLGLHPALRPTDIDETPMAQEAAEALVVRLAIAKSVAGVAAGSTGSTDDIVLAADTVVTLDGGTLGKPRDTEDAARMLADLSGRTHRVITGVAVRRHGFTATDVVITDVTFRRLTRREITWYVATREPEDKAGAYALQGAGAVLIERIEGSDTNVIGMPLAETVALLRTVGWDPLTTTG